MADEKTLEARRAQAAKDAASIRASINQNVEEVTIETMARGDADASNKQDEDFLARLDAGEDLRDGLYLADLR